MHFWSKNQYDDDRTLIPGDMKRFGSRLPYTINEEYALSGASGHSSADPWPRFVSK